MNLNKLKNPVILTFAVWFAAMIFYLPGLGSYGLVDPWETHYSEVARGMLQRNDFISTYWQDDGFYSKPVLTFWLQAAGMKTAGLNELGSPDDEMAVDFTVERAVRIPVVILAAFAVAMIFFLINGFYGIKAGLAAAAMTAVLPHFALVARQTITDMPFLALMTVAMVFFIMSIARDEDTEYAPFISFKEGKPVFSFDLPVVTVLIISLFFVPQYFLFGEGIRASFNFFGKKIGISGYLVFLPYVILLLDVFAGILSGRTTRSKLFSNTAFAFTGLAILAKGFGALFIPAVVFIFYFMLTGEWEKMKKLDLFRGLFIVIAVSFPWHHAMIIRHGSPFFQEYIIHHHFKRAALGVHGERGIFAYYIRQMVFGLYPLLILLPGIAVHNFRIFTKNKFSSLSEKNKVVLLTILWAVVVFFLFSFMETKFHHYILPVTVPMGILGGLYLNEFSKKSSSESIIPLLTGLAVFLLASRDLTLDPAHIIHLFVYKYNRLFPYEIGFAPVWILSLLIAGSALVLLIKRSITPFIAASFLMTGYLIYFYMAAVGPHWGQKNLHKIYFECRKSPAERLIAWQLNWRGENFYSKNKVLPFMDSDSKKFIRYLKEYGIKKKGEKPEARFLITQASRYKKLKSLLDRELYTKHPDAYSGKRADSLVEILGPGCKKMKEKWVKHYKQPKFKILAEPYPNNKFILVRFYI